MSVSYRQTISDGWLTRSMRGAACSAARNLPEALAAAVAQ